jgi:hypothetical protein
MLMTVARKVSRPSSRKAGCAERLVAGRREGESLDDERRSLRKTASALVALKKEDRWQRPDSRNRR